MRTYITGGPTANARMVRAFRLEHPRQTRLEPLRQYAFHNAIVRIRDMAHGIQDRLGDVVDVTKHLRRRKIEDRHRDRPIIQPLPLAGLPHSCHHAGTDTRHPPATRGGRRLLGHRRPFDDDFQGERQERQRRPRQITPFARSPAKAPASSPNRSPSTESVCSPSSGGGRR